MRKLIVIIVLLMNSGISHAEMVLNSTIGNDPVNEQLCLSRAKITKAKTVPFMIDTDYVASVRSEYPDAVFIATGELHGTLIQCNLREGTGRYEPSSFVGENWAWHIIRPTFHDPPIVTEEGKGIACNLCLKSYLSKSQRSGLDHTSWEFPIVVGSGNSIAGGVSERFGVVIRGSAFYKPANPDLTRVNFICLLSPMFDVRAVQWREGGEAISWSTNESDKKVKKKKRSKKDTNK